MGFLASANVQFVGMGTDTAFPEAKCVFPTYRQTMVSTIATTAKIAGFFFPLEWGGVLVVTASVVFIP